MHIACTSYVACDLLLQVNACRMYICILNAGTDLQQYCQTTENCFCLQLASLPVPSVQLESEDNSPLGSKETRNSCTPSTSVFKIMLDIAQVDSSSL